MDVCTRIQKLLDVAPATLADWSGGREQNDETGHAHFSIELRLERGRVRAQVDHARRRLDRATEPRH